MAAVGTVNLTERHFGNYDRISWDWTADASGNVSGHATTKSFTGNVIRLITVPSTVTAPTDNYDVTVIDETGMDVLVGAGFNRDTATTEQVLEANLGVPVIVDSLDLVISNAGAAGKGTVILYLHRA